MKLKRLAACVLTIAMTCAVALTGCGSSVDANATGATLNEKEISLGFMNFMAKYQQATYDSIYTLYFGTDYWSQEITEGMTMEDSVKSEIASSIERLYLLEEHMADYGVSITEEEMAAIEAAAARFLSDNDQKAIEQMGATTEYVAEMLRLYTIEQKMRAAIYAEEPAEVTDKEAAQRTFSYIRVSATTTTDDEGNSVDLTAEAKAELEVRLTELSKAAQEDFEEAAEADGYSVYSYSYGSDESSMAEEVIAAADAMKEGDVSNLIVTENAYYIIRLDSEFDKEATEQRRTQLIEEKKAAHYTEVCDGYMEAADFQINEDAWAQVTFDKLFAIVTGEETGE